jgi:hypothetical protein
MESVGGWSFARKLEEALKRALPLLGPEARAQVSALLTPQTLGVMATVLVAWVLSHAVGIGEIIDIVILAVGVVGIGFSVFQGVDELYEFAMGTYKAGTTETSMSRLGTLPRPSASSGSRRCWLFCCAVRLEPIGVVSKRRGHQRQWAPPIGQRYAGASLSRAAGASRPGTVAAEPDETSDVLTPDAEEASGP